jgi:L-threonylcarbamoyladenylate synthase
MSTWHIRQAVQTLQQGGIIAYATEAVFGLGCDPWDEAAVTHLLALKQRPLDKGLILIASSLEQLEDFIQPLSTELRQKLLNSWPGPNTWLVPADANIPYYLCGKYDTIAVRVTAHKQVRDLCDAFGGAIVSTSANLAGMPPAKTTREVYWRLPEVDYVLPGLCAGSNKPTTIRHAVTGEIIR